MRIIMTNQPVQEAEDADVSLQSDLSFYYKQGQVSLLRLPLTISSFLLIQTVLPLVPMTSSLDVVVLHLLTQSPDSVYSNNTLKL